MIPPNSWLVPGRNPGTSTRVKIGISKASQNLTNLAAFSEEEISSTPANTAG